MGEVKNIRDKIRAVELYAAQDLNHEAENMACKIRLRVERRCGQLLREMKKKGERQKRGRPKKMSRRATFSDLGITRDQASDWAEARGDSRKAD